MNLQHYVTPATITLAAGIAGGIIALALIGLALWNRRTLARGATSLWQSVFSQGGLFYVGMGLFMLASVVEAGPVLNKIAMHGTLWGYGGHMLVFAFDMISAVSLRARLNARRVYDTRGMQLQMWGICLPAAVSVSANLAGALQGFNANDFNHLFIFAWALPLIGAVFPSMIIVLSLAADHLIDTTAVNLKIDPEEFKAQERKRVQILKVRLETEEELLKEESKIAAIRSERDRAQMKPAREWFFMRWLRPETVAPMALIQAEIDKAGEQVRHSQEQQAQEFAGALAEVQQVLTAITTQLQEVATFKAQLEHVVGTVEGQHQQVRLHIEAITSSVEHLTASVEALKMKPTLRQTEGSSNGSQRAPVMTLHSLATQVHTTEVVDLGRKERAFLFIAEYQRTHDRAEPTLPEIMQAVGCAQGSASNYRSEYRKRQDAQGSELAAVAGVVNE